MFNNYMWQTYLNAGGKAVAEVFKNICENDDFAQKGQDYKVLIKSLHASYCASQFAIDSADYNIEVLIENLAKKELFSEFFPVLELPENETNIRLVLSTLYMGIKNEYAYSPQDILGLFLNEIEYYTTTLFLFFPDLFVPYYFQYNFNVLAKIAQEFEMELPLIPIKKDYQGRFYYYGDFCSALFDFRERHNMSPYELCAFLYDFAPKYIGGIDSYIIKDLPKPKNAFFIGGSKDDKFLANDSAAITCWQCNPDTRAGDMIVMYLRTPISAVDSVWRSVSIGFDDPFFYYYRCTYIANPVSVKRVSQKQLQKDKIFKDIPIVRKNMQGINGVELKPSEYNHLMDLAKANVPKLEFTIADRNQEFINEKDVENKLIKPLIAKLGYSEEEYVQQLYIEIGNHNHALIPDFVLLPVTTRGHQSAFALIEAKHSIPNQKAMEEVRIQARSYAVQLKARYSVIASKDKVWVSTPNDDFSTDIFSATWDELNNADTFSELFKLIGRKAK